MRRTAEAGYTRLERGHVAEPNEPEYRQRPPVAPAPLVTLEEAARQLASDPEFAEWAGAEYAASLAGKLREVHHGG